LRQHGYLGAAFRRQFVRGRRRVGGWRRLEREHELRRFGGLERQQRLRVEQRLERHELRRELRIE
jgi:hypothetical protein